MQGRPEVPESYTKLSYICLWRFIVSCRSLLHLLSMLICTCKEHDFMTTHAIVPCKDIRGYCSVCMTNVRDIVNVIDRSCYVFTFCHSCFPVHRQYST